MRRLTIKPACVISPDPHQVEALDRIAVHRASGGTRGQILMACGTGKTLVSAWAVGRMDAKKAVFLAPSLAIVKQAGETYASIGLAPTAFVCGAADVAEKSDGDVTRDLDTLVRLLQDRDEWVIFGTYHSAAVIAEALRILGGADLVICDEAHHLAGAKGKTWADVLHDHELPAKHRLFFTATQRVKTRANEKIVGMEDEAVFGPVVYELTFREAIECKIICDYRVMVVWVPRALDGKIDVEAAILQAVERARNEGKIQNGIIFGHTVRQAKDRAKFYEGRIYAEAITGAQPLAVRDEIASEAIRLGGFVTTAKAIGEGVNVPAFDSATFVNSKSSIVDITQNIGRVLRIPRGSDGTKIATIIVPAIMPEGDERDLADYDGCKVLARTLAGLREMDERMAAEIALAVQRKINGGLADDTEDFLHVHGLLEALSGPAGDAVLRDACGDDWGFERGFASLLSFVDNNGHARVPHMHITVDGYHLGKFVGQCRSYCKSAPYRARRLEALKGWTWNAQDSRFIEMLSMVRAFSERHGRLPRSGGFQVPHNEQILGGWIGSQREKRARQPIDRVAMLESLPHWSWIGRGMPATENGRAAFATAVAVARHAKSARARGRTLSAIGAGAVTLEGMRKSGLSFSRAIVSRLTHDGMIERDTRSHAHLYRLTPAGQAALAEYERESATDPESITAHITENGPIKSDDIAAALHLVPRDELETILNSLVTDGKIDRLAADLYDYPAEESAIAAK